MNVERYKQLLSPDKPLPGNDSNPAPFKTESNLRLGTAEADIRRSSVGYKT
jgi:hypothetical protein